MTWVLIRLAALHLNLLPPKLLGSDLFCKTCRKELDEKDLEDDSILGYCTDCQEEVDDTPTQTPNPEIVNFLPLSSKLEALYEAYLKMPKGDKMIVFSRFVAMLRIVQAFFNSKGVGCLECR